MTGRSNSLPLRGRTGVGVLRSLLAFTFLSWVAPTIASAASLEDANRLYTAGEFDDARDAYRELVASGVDSEDLYYNLGNAHFRLGALGPAIYSYERALRLDPDMSDARYNLEVARSAVGEKIRDRLEGAERQSRWVRMARHFTISELTVGVLALNALFFGLLIALRFLVSGFRRSVLRVLSAFVGVALLASAALLGGNIYLRERVDEGIVLPDQASLREGNSADTAERGQVHAGLKVRVVETRGPWTRVRLSNGVEGWLEGDQLGRL